jgi:hypothetical protein
MADNTVLQFIAASGIIGAVITYYLTNRAQNKERGYTAYFNSALEYIKLQEMMLKDHDLGDIYSYDDFYRKLDPLQKKRYHFYNMTLMMFEVVYLAHRKKWMKKDEGMDGVRGCVK